MKWFAWIFCLPVIFLFAASLDAGDVNTPIMIREWDVATPHSRPHDPAVAPDGSLWYTGQMANKLGRFDPKSEKFTEFPLCGREVARTDSSSRESFG
jgi:streptogramin lyase